MSGSSSVTANCANFGTARTYDRDRKAVRLNGEVMRISREIWPVKTSQYLADMTGYSVRACEYWLSGARVLPADALATLMQSENGKEFLVAALADSTPRWWLRLKAWLSAVDIAVEQAKHRRKLRKLIDDAAPELTPAMLLQDEDFYSGQPSPHRPVASKGKRKLGG